MCCLIGICNLIDEKCTTYGLNKGKIPISPIKVVPKFVKKLQRTFRFKLKHQYVIIFSSQLLRSSVHQPESIMHILSPLDLCL